jgi:uncharacterized protein YodC (DUF2158 family)
MKKRFQRGDIVRLKSGGPQMTVREEKKGALVCDWFEGDKLRRESFFAEQLTEAATASEDLEVAQRIAVLLQEAMAKKNSPHPNSQSDAAEEVFREEARQHEG